MHIILMGAQGAGKGTQAGRVAPRLGLTHLATGDLFRAAIAAGTDLGRRVKGILDAGELVPDDVTVELVEEKLDELKAARTEGTTGGGALFDGFPRTRAQAEALDRVLAARGEELTAVIAIEVPLEKLVERLAGRRVCASCGTSYHVEFNPPRETGVCDRCGGALVQRHDDTPGPIRKRLGLYLDQTAPLLADYRKRGLLVEVNGDQPIETVTDAIIDAVAQVHAAA